MPRELDPARLGDHLDRLYRAAWALCGSRADAEDLVQETYARVLSRRRLLRRQDDLGYLLTVLRNTFLDQVRTQRRRPTVPLPEDHELLVESPSPSAQATLEAREVYAAVTALAPAYRDAVVAVDVAGLSYNEAARHLGVPVGTIMSRLYRGRDQIIRAIEGQAS
jgi:RNA polymerase sigma-70 factor (ECF subfamily)